MTIASLLILISNANAQDTGGGIYLTYLNGGIVNTTAINGVGEFVLNQNVAIAFNLGLIPKHEVVETYELRPFIQSGNQIERLEVPFNTQLSGYKFSGVARYYPWSDIKDKFGFYGFFGVGYMIFNVSSEPKVDYDPSFDTPSKEELAETRRYTNVILETGVGADYNLFDRFFLFAESGINLITVENTKYVQIPFKSPSTFSVGAGLKMYLQ